MYFDSFIILGNDSGFKSLVNTWPTIDQTLDQTRDYSFPLSPQYDMPCSPLDNDNFWLPTADLEEDDSIDLIPYIPNVNTYSPTSE